MGPRRGEEYPSILTGRGPSKSPERNGQPPEEGEWDSRLGWERIQRAPGCSTKSRGST